MLLGDRADSGTYVKLFARTLIQMLNTDLSKPLVSLSAAPASEEFLPEEEKFGDGISGLPGLGAIPDPFSKPAKPPTIFERVTIAFCVKLGGSKHDTFGFCKYLTNVLVRHIKEAFS